MARVLIVDDEASIRNILRKALEQSGYEVDEVSDGSGVAKNMRKAAYDLVITDIIMPDTEGLEVIMELRRDYPDLKIVAISGGGYSVRGEYLAAARKLGADRTFAKPFSLRELIAAVDELIGG